MARGSPTTTYQARGWSSAIIIDLLRDGESVQFYARGGSMWPSIRDGALVEIVPAPLHELVPGELAAFTRDGGLVVHRVRAIHPKGLLFAGDAGTSDGIIEAPDILGRARVVEQRSLRLRLPSRRQVRLLLRWGVLNCLAWLRASKQRRGGGEVRS